MFKYAPVFLFFGLLFSHGPLSGQSLENQSAQSQCAQLLTTGPNEDILLNKASKIEAFLIEKLSTILDVSQQERYASALVEFESFADYILELEEQNSLERIQLLKDLNSFDAFIKSINLTEEPKTRLDRRRLSRVEILRPAAKDYNRLQPHLQSKYNQFVRDVEALEDARLLSPTWSFKKISLNDVVPGGGYSVRLNGGYRVVFDIKSNHTVIVYRISQTVTH